jgi:FAD/FMN-containing dehydrogenase
VTTASRTTTERELRALLGESGVLPGDSREYLHDATESRGVSGRADAVALPGDAAQVTEVVAWCYAHDVASSRAAAARGSPAARSRTVASC